LPFREIIAVSSGQNPLKVAALIEEEEKKKIVVYCNTLRKHKCLLYGEDADFLKVVSKGCMC